MRSEAPHHGSSQPATFAIGIDFGTTTSLVYVYEKGRTRPLLDSSPQNRDHEPWMPSIVGTIPHPIQTGGDQLAIGWPAIDYQESAIHAIKRFLGHPTHTLPLVSVAGVTHYRPTELCALILRRIALNASHTLSQPVQDVVLSVPANFGGSARQALLAASRMAGLNPVRLINEPTAAAFSYLATVPLRQARVLVFDFGGGTLDISVLQQTDRRVRVLSTYGNPVLGGIDLDRALAQWLYAQILAAYPDLTPRRDLLVRLRLEAERAKQRLSTSDRATIFIPDIGTTDANQNQAFNKTISRLDFEEVIRPHLAQAKSCLEIALSRAKLLPASIDRVILVGGTTLIPAVQALVTTIFEPEKCQHYEPIGAVAAGAAQLAAQEAGLVPPTQYIDLIEVAGNGIGLRVLKPLPDENSKDKNSTDIETKDAKSNNEKPGTAMPSRQYQYLPLIPPNQTLPFEEDYRLSLQSPRQRQLTLWLYEGDSYQTCDWNDQRFVPLVQKTFDIYPSTSRQFRSTDRSSNTITPQVRLNFTYDRNAVINISATLESTGQSLLLSHDMRYSNADLASGEQRVKETWKFTGRNWEDAPIFEPILPPVRLTPALLREMLVEILETENNRLSAHLNEFALSPLFSNDLALPASTLLGRSRALIQSGDLSRDSVQSLSNELREMTMRLRQQIVAGHAQSNEK